MSACGRHRQNVLAHVSSMGTMAQLEHDGTALDHDCTTLGYNGLAFNLTLDVLVTGHAILP